MHRVEEEAAVTKLLEGHDLKTDKYYLKHEANLKNFVERYSNYLGMSLEARDRELMVIKYVSPELGFGAFAKKLIKKGELIGKYVGVLRLNAENADYAWSYKTRYIEDVRIKIRIDARLKGNYLRFVNHAGPDRNVDPEYVPYNNRWHVIYIARRDIQPGEELTTDYGQNYFDSRKLI